MGVSFPFIIIQL